MQISERTVCEGRGSDIDRIITEDIHSFIKCDLEDLYPVLAGFCSGKADVARHLSFRVEFSREDPLSIDRLVCIV